MRTGTEEKAKEDERVNAGRGMFVQRACMYWEAWTRLHLTGRLPVA